MEQHLAAEKSTAHFGEIQEDNVYLLSSFFHQIEARIQPHFMRLWGYMRWHIKFNIGSKVQRCWVTSLMSLKTFIKFLLKQHIMEKNKSENDNSCLCQQVSQIRTLECPLNFWLCFNVDLS